MARRGVAAAVVCGLLSSWTLSVQAAVLAGSLPGAQEVKVLDATGRTVVRGLSVSGDGAFHWDGRISPNVFAPAGRYLAVASDSPGPTEMAGIDWIRCQDDPALDLGNAECFDAGGVYMPTAWVDGDTTKVCYAGFDGSEGGIYRIGLAWSVDGGASWNRSCEPVLSEGAPGNFDDTGVLAPHVFREPSGALVMHYAGFSGGPFDGRYEIGRAESADGGHTWVRSIHNPIFDGKADWSEASLFTAVVPWSGGLTMWFVGLDFENAAQPWKIGRATSTDGIDWTIAPADPVYEGTQAWEAFGTPSLDVVKYGGEYVLWAGGTDGNELSVGRAVSSDGISWSADPDNPLVTSDAGTWDATDVTEPTANYSAAGLTLFHAGSDDLFVSRVGCKIDPAQGISGDIPADGARAGARLMAPSPNPFNPWTRIAFELDRPGSAILEVFDPSGRRVRVLASGPQPAGLVQVNWDGTNGAGRPVVSGVYTAVLRFEGGRESIRLVLLR